MICLQRLDSLQHTFNDLSGDKHRRFKESLDSIKTSEELKDEQAAFRKKLHELDEKRELQEQLFDKFMVTTSMQLELQLAEMFGGSQLQRIGRSLFGGGGADQRQLGSVNGAIDLRNVRPLLVLHSRQYPKRVRIPPICMKYSYFVMSGAEHASPSLNLYSMHICPAFKATRDFRRVCSGTTRALAMLSPTRDPLPSPAFFAFICCCVSKLESNVCDHAVRLT